MDNELVDRLGNVLEELETNARVHELFVCDTDGEREGATRGDIVIDGVFTVKELQQVATKLSATVTRYETSKRK